MARADGKPALSGRALGLILIFLTAIIWVAASFVSQLLVTNEEGRTNFNVPPFLLTYLSTSIFTIFLPLVQLKSLLQETLLLRRSFKYKQLQQTDEESAPIDAGTAAAAHDDDDDDDDDGSVGVGGRGGAAAGGGGGGSGGLGAALDVAEATAAAEAAAAAARASRLAHKEALVAAAQCFLLWFAAQFLFNQSLQLTSVTSNTILSSSSSLFTFALSMIFLKEPYSIAKLLSIAACIGGTLLVTLSDDGGGGGSGSGKSSSGPNHSVWGDLLCLVSAAFYACYTIVLRKALPDDEEANVALFFGYVGLLCSVTFAPVVALLGGLGVLHLKTIPPKAYLIILVQGILNYCLSDYLWAHAVLLLGPTIATLGLSVQIPVAAGVEAVIGHPKWLTSGAAMAMTLTGTGLIMAGFVAGNLAGGGHVYGSHHREDFDGDLEEQQQQQERNSPAGRLQDDSFTTDHRRGAAAAAAAAQHTSGGGSSRGGSAGGGPAKSSSPHQLTNGSSNHQHHHHHDTNNRSSSATSGSPPGSDSCCGGVDGGDGGDDGGGKAQSHFDAHVFAVPVSTHACIRPSDQGGGGGGGGVGSSSSPRADKAESAVQQQQQPLPPPQQQQQQWESIELSSSLGSEVRSEQSSPLSLSGPPMRHRAEQQQQQRSPLARSSAGQQDMQQQQQLLSAPPPAPAAAVTAAPGPEAAGLSLLDDAAALPIPPQQQPQAEQQQQQQQPNQQPPPREFPL